MNPSCAFLFALVCLGLAGCRQPSMPPANAPEPQRYEVRGIVRSIGFADRTITVEHEDIPGFMAAMTMPFTVRDMKEVEALKAGEAIAFQLAVTENDSWITGIKTIPRGEVRLPASKPAPASRANVPRVKPGEAMPDFSLIDDQSRPITRATFTGKPLLLTFIFTRCPIPNFCPLMSSHFASIRESIAGDPALRDTELLSISIDPEFDTPEVLASHAATHRGGATDGWRFATGAKEQVEKLAAAFAVQVKPEGGSIDHGLATALIGRDGVVREIWRGNGWKPAEVVEALRALESGR